MGKKKKSRRIEIELKSNSSSDSLFNSLKSLSADDSFIMDDDEQEDTFNLFSVKVKTEEEGTKKKKKKEKEEKPKEKLTFDQLLERRKLIEDDDDISSSLIKQGKSMKRRSSQSDNPFKKEFIDQELILFDMMGKINSEADEVQKFIDEKKKYRSTNSKILADLYAVKANMNSSKLQIIKEINAMKKAAIELKFKDDDRQLKIKSNSGEETNEIKASSDFYRQFLSNKNSIMADMGVVVSGREETNVDNEFNIDDYTMAAYDELTDDEMTQKIQDNLREYGGRSDEGDAYIINEHLGVEVYVEKLDDSGGNYRFIAIGNDGNEVHNYPLPHPNTPLKFNDDGGSAKDNLGRIYHYYYS